MARRTTCASTPARTPARPCATTTAPGAGASVRSQRVFGARASTGTRCQVAIRRGLIRRRSVREIGARRSPPRDQVTRCARVERTIQIVNAHEHNLKSLSVDIPRGKFNVDHRRLGLRQVDAGVRHSVQRRPAPLPGIAQRLRPLHRAAGRPARGGRGVWHSAHGGHRAAPVARRAQVHGGHHHRGLALSAPAVSSSWARSTASTTARRWRRRRRTALPRSCSRTFAASTSACWRRW